MTAAIEARGAGGGESEAGWTIRFVMAQGLTLAQIPKPDDPAIRMRETPSARYAVPRYSGLAGDATIEAKTAEFIAILKVRHIEDDPPLFAFYDPPWTPSFLRRNEILIRLK